MSAAAPGSADDRRPMLPLRIAIPLLVATLALLLAAFSVFYHAHHAERGVERLVLNELTQFMSQRQGAFTFLLRERRYDQLQREISAMGSDPDLRLAMVFDDRGSILASTRMAVIGGQAEALLPEYCGDGPSRHEALIAAARATLAGQVALTGDRAAVVGFYPVMLGAAPDEPRPTRVGMIFVRRDLDRLKAEARAAVLLPTLQYAAVLGVAALLLGSFLHLRVSQRVRRLVAASEGLARGDLGTRADVGGGDELGQIGQSFDRMAATLDAQQAQLRTERDFISAVLDTVDSIVVVLDRTGRIVRFNRACERLTGYAAARVLHRPVWDLLIPPEQVEAVKNVFAALTRERLPSRYENEWLTRAGGRRLIGWSNTVLPDARGEVDFVIATGIDITDRRRAEQALEASAARYRGLFESSTVSLWLEDISELRALLDEVRDRVGGDWRGYFAAHPELVARCARAVRVIDVNAQTLRLYGAASKQQLLGSLDRVFADDSYTVFTENLVAVAEGQSEFHAETRNRTLAGQPLDVMMSVRIPPPGTPAEPAVVAIVDISERRRVDEVIAMLARRSGERPLAQFLQDSMRQLAAIYGARYAFVGRLVEPERTRVATQAVWAGDRIADNFVYDLDGTPCQDILDFRAELIPRDAWRRYPRDRLLKEMGVESYFGASLVTSDGRLIGLVSVMDTRPMELAAWVRPVLGVFATRLANEFEREEHAAEREALVAELTARNAEMENFVYTISHDLKTPLITISGFAGLLDKDLARGDREAARDSLTEIRKAVDQMSAHIQDLLTLSRAGRAMTEREPLDLRRLIAEALEPFAQRIRDGGAEVVVAADLPTVNVDRKGFGRVFGNLIDNALKYRRDDDAPRIDIGASRVGDELRIWVQDNGVGIRPEYHERIFGLFERADSRAEGTGVGLAIARRVVEIHGGRLWVESEPGRGSRFWLSLPAADIVDAGGRGGPA